MVHSLDTRIECEAIVERVRQAYSAAATEPAEEHPFPVGREFAQSVGYRVEVLDRLPSASVEAFCGVSNLAALAAIPEGSRVLDLGCGAGLDTLIAAGRTGPEGEVVGIDFSQAMVDRARQSARELGLTNAHFFVADAAQLPFRDEAMDIALVNGIFNLNPARQDVFRELARVIRPGGRVYAAEIVLKEPLPAEIRENVTNWFA